MPTFPDFVKSPTNRIAASSLYTRGVNQDIPEFRVRKCDSIDMP